MGGGTEGTRRANWSRAIENRMQDGHLREVMVWDADGNVIYADDPAEIGHTGTSPRSDRGNQPRDDQFCLRGRAGNNNPEDEEIAEGFVEVYVPLDMPGYPPYVFEAYYDYARVNDNANNLMTQLVPLVLIPLVALVLIQVPIAVSLSRRIRRNDAERSALLEHSLTVSERERIRIAADLHDGPIQELAGIGYALGSVAASVPERQRA